MSASMTDFRPHRVAVYYAPEPHSEHARAGQRWLALPGDASPPHDEPSPLAALLGPEAAQAVLADPRHYGFHGTLKAPFRMKEGVALSHVLAEVEALASATEAFDLPPLAPAPLGPFLALQPQADGPELDAMAAACVTQLHHLAAPLNDLELAKRRRVSLSAQQEALMQRWGYPYVLQEFRFHMTLTGSLRGLAASQQAALLRAAQQHFSGLRRWTMSALSVFVQTHIDADFVLHAQLPLRQA